MGVYSSNTLVIVNFVVVTKKITIYVDSCCLKSSYWSYC